MTFFVIEKSTGKHEITTVSTDNSIVFCTFDEAYYYIERKNVTELETVFHTVVIDTLADDSGIRWTADIENDTIVDDNVFENENTAILHAIEYLTNKFTRRVLQFRRKNEL